MRPEKERFLKLVRDAEAVSALRPRWARYRAVAFAMLGYGVVCAVLLTLVAGVVTCLVGMYHADEDVGGFWVAGAAVAGMMTFGLFRSLVVAIPHAPEGEPLSREDAPRLYEFLDELKVRARGPRMHRVIVTPHCAASVFSRPLLGFFGLPTHTLCLGAPFLAGLSTDECRAVIVHEYAHIHASDNGYLQWVYRVQATWNTMIARNQSRLFGWFLRWYGPRLSAYTFAFSRQAEYEADRAAADAVGARTAGEALLRTCLILEHFDAEHTRWLDECVKQSAVPPNDIVSHHLDSLRGGEHESEETLAKWLRPHLLMQTTYDDTHPAISERLAHMGSPRYSPTEVPRLTPRRDSALDRLIQPVAAGRVIASLDGEMRRLIRPQWEMRHAYLAQLREESEKAEADKSITEPEPRDERDEFDAWIRQAERIIETRTLAEAIPLAERVLERDPRHARARFMLGMHLFEQRDPAGADHFRFVVEHDARLRIAACERLYIYLRGEGKTEEAETFRDRAEAHAETLQAAQRERSQLSSRDRLLPHGESPARVKAIRDAIAARNDVRRAYLVRAHVAILPEIPWLILVVEPIVPWYTLNRTARATAVLWAVAATVVHPDGVQVFPLAAINAQGLRVANVQGALIYESPSRS